MPGSHSAGDSGSAWQESYTPSLASCISGPGTGTGHPRCLSNQTSKGILRLGTACFPWALTFHSQTESAEMGLLSQHQVLLILSGGKWVNEGLKESPTSLLGPGGSAETIRTRAQHRQPLQELKCRQGWAVCERLRLVCSEPRVLLISTALRPSVGLRSELESMVMVLVRMARRHTPFLRLSSTHKTALSRLQMGNRTCPRPFFAFQRNWKGQRDWEGQRENPLAQHHLGGLLLRASQVYNNPLRLSSRAPESMDEL